MYLDNFRNVAVLRSSFVKERSAPLQKAVFKIFVAGLCCSCVFVGVGQILALVVGPNFISFEHQPDIFGCITSFAFAKEVSTPSERP